jgi:tctex1 domain-containing protein 2
MNIPRYKIIVQGTIGQLRDQGIRIASRCLWDVSTDNYTSVSYTNVRQSSFILPLTIHLC